MLVAVISDTHLPRGARRLPEVCVEALRGADLILHGGDLSAAAVLLELRALGPAVHAVYGNADEPALRASLPKELVVEVEDARIGIVHDRGPRPAGRSDSSAVSRAATPSSSGTRTCRSSSGTAASGCSTRARRRSGAAGRSARSSCSG